MCEITETYLKSLIAERDAITREGERTTEDRRTVALDQQSVGRLSRMDAMQQQSMAHAQERRRQARLMAIDAALARIASRDYGFCEDCGEDIAPGRLSHDPTVMRCIDCARG